MGSDNEGLEEHFARREKRESRALRKRAQRTDRSGQKKSDREKERPAEIPLHLPRGRVLAMLGREIVVDHRGERLHCVLRGSLKEGAKRLKTLLAVGDFVRFEPTTEGEGVIVAIEKRRSLLTRADPLSKRRAHLIAANIDLVLITGSVVSPPLKPPLIDRYLIAARKGGMEAAIVLNKVDLLQGGEEQTLYDHFVATYREIGYTVIPTSIETGEGIEEIRSAMRGKAAAFSGQSGVGKSSLINAVCGTHLAVGDVVRTTQKGSHTTTRAQLLPLGEETYCIDTPGIKSFGVWELTAEELQSHFPEIAQMSSGCRFPNCSHTHEPSCAVLEALEAGTLSQLRYRSYTTLLAELDTPHLRR
ncbi:MAG: ribosome small subunit-dependent GTPase A [Parachlamydiales bacterium]